MPIKTSYSPFAEVAEQPDAFERLDLRVHVTAGYADLGVVVGEVLGHALGEGGDEDALVFADAVADFREQVVDLSLYRADFNRRIDQAGGTDDLFYDHASRLGEFVRAGSSGDVDDLPGAAFELVELERPVVHRAGQAKPVVDEVLLAAAVAMPHAVELRDRDVGFVDK